MPKLILIALTFCFTVNFPVNSQDDETNRKKELQTRILSADTGDEIISNAVENIIVTKEKKSPGLALLLSLAIPGAGHFYADRMDVGKYFFTAEVMSWLGILGFNLYGDYLQNDARSYALLHSGLSKENKDDEYFSNVGNYNNIYEYNDEKLRRGEYEKMYDVNSHFWNWDSFNNRVIYDNQRKKSERIYNSRIIFASTLIINRIVSAISSVVLTSSKNAGSSSFKLFPEITSSSGKVIDGLKINLTKSF